MTNSVAQGVAYSDPAIVGGAIDNTPIGATTRSSIKCTTLDANGAVTLGDASTDVIAFYGATGSARRGFSSAVHATSGASVSSSFGATQLAILQELQATNIALGIWATA